MTQTEALYVRQALAYVSNVPFLLREREHGRLADEGAIWAECQRAIATLEDALRVSSELSNELYNGNGRA